MDINLKLENALKDENITNMMNESSKSFIKYLDEDTIQSCKLYALWRSLVNFDPERKIKFTTYLYNAVKFECLKHLKKNKRHSQNRKTLHSNMESHNSTDVLMIDLFDEAKTEDQRQLLVDKMNYLSNGKIAQKHGVTRETLRKRYKKFTKGFKEKFV
jgi:DNA-directed RNA polymerase specialized sigma24 family protein